MPVEQLGSISEHLKTLAPNTDLVLVFGNRFYLDNSLTESIQKQCPDAVIAGGSTSGPIYGKNINSEDIVLNTFKFDSTKVQSHSVVVESMSESQQAGEKIGAVLNTQDLRLLLIIADGLSVNGSSLVEGIKSKVSKHVLIVGGLTGDGDRFKKTLTLNNSGLLDNTVVAVAFYGDKFQASSAALGGWLPFGTLKKVTKAENNIVYEIDGEPALDIYVKYLGDEAKDLPGSGLLYPLELLENEGSRGLIRTLLGVDYENSSLTFAGNVPEGSIVRLMHANFEDLCDGAGSAADTAMFEVNNPDFAFLVSCVGRKIMMGELTDLELESVHYVLGESVPLGGFYSYGEIAPLSNEHGSQCMLHNQSMTIVLMREN